jgi:hypothetical protein
MKIRCAVNFTAGISTKMPLSYSGTQDVFSHCAKVYKAKMMYVHQRSFTWQRFGSSSGQYAMA